VSNRPVTELLRDGALMRDPTAKVDGALFDLDGNAIVHGNTNPNIIGPDDKVEFSFRPDTAFPDVPPQVKNAEIRFILPMARFLASSLNITVIDETAYDRILPALKQRSLFVALNLYKVQIADGVATWFGLVMPCKQHWVVLVQFKMKLSTEQIGISQVRLWSAAYKQYFVSGERDLGRFYTREEASAKILNYLKVEGITPDI
jgi:hypothetical protein